MKRVLFLMVLFMAASFSFAQQKNVKEVKSIIGDVKPDFAKAEKLINEALTNSETKDDPETWNTAGLVQKKVNEKQMESAYLRKPYDTVKTYNSILEMFNYFVKCDDLAQIPDAKGKIKNKYRKANAATMVTERPNLINGGIHYFNLGKDKEAFRFFSVYVDAASYPMLETENLAAKDTLLSQIAYYTILAAEKSGNKEAVKKYAPLALKDKEGGKIVMQLLADAVKAEGDTVKWVEVLKEGITKFPDNQYFFANLVDYYSSSNQPDKAMQFADEMLAKDPDNKLYLYVKAYLYHNMKEYDKSIEFYKKTIAADPEYVEAYSNLGLVLLMQAQDYSDQSTSDVNDPKYKEAQARLKKYFEDAKPYYEKARSIAPDRKDLWIQGLYRIYYNLNMGKEFEEIEKLMQ